MFNGIARIASSRIWGIWGNRTANNNNAQNATSPSVQGTPQQAPSRTRPVAEIPLYLLNPRVTTVAAIPEHLQLLVDSPNRATQILGETIRALNARVHNRPDAIEHADYLEQIQPIMDVAMTLSLGHEPTDEELRATGLHELTRLELRVDPDDQIRIAGILGTTYGKWREVRNENSPANAQQPAQAAELDELSRQAIAELRGGEAALLLREPANTPRPAASTQTIQGPSPWLAFQGFQAARSGMPFFDGPISHFRAFDAYNVATAQQVAAPEPRMPVAQFTTALRAIATERERNREGFSLADARRMYPEIQHPSDVDEMREVAGRGLNRAPASQLQIAMDQVIRNDRRPAEYAMQLFGIRHELDEAALRQVEAEGPFQVPRHQFRIALDLISNGRPADEVVRMYRIQHNDDLAEVQRVAGLMTAARAEAATEAEAEHLQIYPTIQISTPSDQARHSDAT